MPLINTSIPNFIGGVSQQPAAIRKNNEAEEIINAIPSPVEGLIKRPPAEYVTHLYAGVPGTSPAGNQANKFWFDDPTNSLFFHLIERDETEKYLLYIDKNGRYGIYDLIANTPKSVFTGAGSLFGGVDSPAQRSAVTIGDVTFVANAKTQPIYKTSAGNSPQIPSNYEQNALVWVRQVNYGREHIIKITAGTQSYDYRHCTRSVLVTNTGTSNGTSATTIGPVTLTYVQGVKADVYPQAYITYGGAQNRVTDVRIVTDFEGLEQPLSVQGPGDTGSEVGVLLAIPTQNSVSGAQVRIKADSSGALGTAHVADSLTFGRSSGYIGPRDGLASTIADGAGADAPFETDRFSNTRTKDGVIWIKSRTTSPLDFDITVEDDFAGDGMTLIRDTVERFEDLPPTAPHGYMVKVKGIPESSYDDYWVKFEAEDGDFSRGVWVETVAPGIKYQIDPASMPILVIRNDQGSFVVKLADGTSATGVPDSASYLWADRLVGDEDTNPEPSFLGKTYYSTGPKIEGLVYFQGRLGAVSGENIIFSEAGQFFNFWRTTVLDLLDTDPVDIASSSPKSGAIRAVVPFNRDLILWSSTNQSVLRTGDTFTPKSVAIATAADYENQSSICRPVSSANSIFFTYNNGGYVGLRELVPQPALDGSYLANDLTTNVSRYIYGLPNSLAASTHDNIVALIADRKLYLYRYLAINNERAQSAWVRCEFEDSSELFVDEDPHGSQFAEPIWVGFIESDMYVALSVRRKTGLIAPYANSWIPVLVKVRMGSGLTDAPINDWITHLDFRFRLTTGTYVGGATNQTTFNLPFPLDYAEGRLKVVNDEGNSVTIVGGTPAVLVEGANTGGGNTAGTVVVSGNYSDEDVWVGVPYEMKYTFSTQYLKRGPNMPALLTGRFQILNMAVQFAETGYFKVTTETPDGASYEYEFAGDILGSSLTGAAFLKNGQFRVPIFSKNDNITISIINNSFLPCKILSGEIEAEYTTRSSSM
jgi:hypothetical protein